MRTKPRVLIEIKNGSLGPYSRISTRIVFIAKPSCPVKFAIATLHGVAFILLFSYVVFGSVVAPVDYTKTFASQGSDSDRVALEQQLLQLEQQISQYESTVSSYRRQGSSLKAEIDGLNAKSKKINLQIQAVKLSLSKLDEEIVQNKAQVGVVEDNLNFNKKALSGALQNIYEHDKVGLVEMLLANSQISNFVNDLNNLFLLQDSLRERVQKIADLRAELLDSQEQLGIKKADAVALKQYQDSQRVAILGVQKEKNQLLAVTKGQESKYQELLQQTKKTAAEIRSQIFEFLGGGEMSFGDAYNFAKLAGQASGIRPAFILGILDKESAFGQNVGKCSYKIAMAPGPPKSKRDDVAPFLSLMSALKLNPDTMLVSCSNRDGFYGGAMGPTQFIPTTWKLYADKIAEITGHNPASPWNNGDAITGTALYLKDAMNACDNKYSKQLDVERCAAARYYGGGNWKTYLWTYGDRVVAKAQKFQQDIDVLDN